MDIRAIFMGVLFAVMWASAFTSARVIVGYASPLWALSFRFMISGLIGIGIAYLLGQRVRLTAGQWRATIVFGICQNALYLGLNFIAMQKIEASLAAIIASSMPLAVAFAGWVVFREKLQPLAMVGLIAGMIGVGLIMATRLSGGADIMGVLLCVVAMVALTIATLSVRSASSGGNLLMVVGLQMLVGSAVLFVAAVIFEPLYVDVTWALSVAFIYTTLVPGLSATIVWFLLVQRIGSVPAATFHFLTPFFGVLIAAFVLGEHLRIVDLVGVAIITCGIFAVQYSKAKHS
ncbi:MAG: DMT family transporter [Halocynthiibacter sp.]